MIECNRITSIPENVGLNRSLTQAGSISVPVIVESRSRYLDGFGGTTRLGSQTSSSAICKLCQDLIYLITYLLFQRKLDLVCGHL